jgi:hypothetical protein
MGQALFAAAILGPLWALLGATRGVELREYLVLACSASVSLWIAQLAVQSVKENREALAKVGVILGLSGLALLPFGYWLKSRTHHAGLASATYAVIGFGLILLIALMFSRARIAHARAQVVLVGLSVLSPLGLIGLALLGARSGDGSRLYAEFLDAAVGVVLVAIAVRHGAKVPAAFTKRLVTVPLSLAVFLGCVLGVVSGYASQLLEKAAVLAGPVGLLG